MDKQKTQVFKKVLSVSLTITTILWSVGAPLGVLFAPDTARAVVTPTVTSLVTVPRDVKASSSPIAAIKVVIAVDAAETLNAITVVTTDIGSSGFAPTTDLAALSATTEATSGIALYNDAGATAGSFDGTDIVIDMSSVSAWSAGPNFTTTLILQNTATAGTFYIVFRTAAAAVNAHSFALTLPANGITTSANSPTITAVSTSAITVDTVAPGLTSSVPQNTATNVPASTLITVIMNDNLQQSTVTPANVTLTTGGNPVGAGVQAFPNGFNLVVSNAPTFAAGSRFAKLTTAATAFYSIAGTSPITPQGSYTSPTVGDIVYTQHDTFPPEVGVITNATLTSGTFAVNGFAPFQGQQITKLATPVATGAVTDATSVTTGDLIVAYTQTNPTDDWYDWHIVTTGAAVNNAALRIDGASGAPTFGASTRFSTVTPTATATDNGVTGGNVLAVVLGDLVFVKIGASYAWHLVTSAGNLSSDATENTAFLDDGVADPAIAALSQMSSLAYGAQGPVTDTTTQVSFGDLVLAKTTANAANNNVYAIHLVTGGATGVSNTAVRFDNATTPLLPSTSYLVTIGTGVQDDAGNSVASNITIAFTTASFAGGTAFNPPPFVLGTVPTSGSTLPINGKIAVNFSKAMNTAGEGSVLDINNTQLFLLANGAKTGSNLFTSNTGWAFDAAKNQLTVALPTLTANSFYRLIVKGDNNTLPADGSCGGTGEPECVMSTDSLAFPGPDYSVEFKAVATDSAAPSVVGSFPDNNATGVDRGIFDLAVSFSEPLDPSTVSLSTVLLLRDGATADVAQPGNYDLVTDSGEDTVIATGSVTLEADGRTLHFSPNAVLSASAKHFLVLRAGASGIKDPAGNKIGATEATNDVARAFTTGANVNGQATDNTAPTVLYGNADNFGVFVTLSEAVKFGSIANGTKASSQGPNDANNLSNWTLETSADGTNFTAVPLSGTQIFYDAGTSTVQITGVSMPPSQQFRATGAVAMQDLAGNALNNTAKTAQGTVASSGGGGQLGPGGGTGAIDFFSMGTNPIMVFPKSAIAGATTGYRVEFGATTAIPGSGKVTLTFPTGFGFDTTNADTAKRCTAFPSGSVFPENSDINGPSTGTVTVSTVACSAVSRTITLTLGSVGTVAGDTVRFLIQGVVNSTVPKDFSTSGYSVDVKTYNAANTLLDTKTSMPFFISTPGTRTVAGKVFVDNGAGTGGVANDGIPNGTEAGVQSVNVCMGGGMGFDCKATDASGDYSFTQLNDGFYNINVAPITSGTVTGGPFFKDVNISGSNVTGVNFPLQQASAQNILDVYVSGGTALASTAIDVFAFSTVGAGPGTAGPGPGGFVVREVTLDGSGVGTAALPLSTGVWEVMVGPRMNKEPGSMPTMPDFNFMPPTPVQIKVDATTGVPDLCTTGAGASTGEVCVTLTAATLEIRGKIVDGSGAAISNAFVGAQPSVFDPTTGSTSMGADQTDVNGLFTVKVTTGTYVVDAFMPGMDHSSLAKECTVKADTGNSGTDNNSTADVSCNGVLVVNDVAAFSSSSLTLANVGANDLVITIAKGDTSVTGRVLDETGGAISFAHVQAMEVDALGAPLGAWKDAPTDNTGTYIIYVNGGTTASPKSWKITAFAPQFGELPSLTVAVVTGSNLTGKNLQVATGSFITVSGTVYADNNSNNTPDTGEGIKGAFVNVFGSLGGNSTVTSSDAATAGAYTLNVRAGTGYTIEAFVPGQGPTDQLTSQDLSAARTGKNLKMAQPGTLVVYVCTLTTPSSAPSASNGCASGQLTTAYVDVRDSQGRGHGTGSNTTAGKYEIIIPAGTYTVNAHDSAAGSVGSQSSVAVTGGGTTYVNIVPPQTFLVSGTVASTSAACVEGMTVFLTDSVNGRVTLARAAASGTWSSSVPNGTYRVGAGRSGCVDSADPGTVTVASAALTQSGDADLARTMIPADATIVGRVTLSGTNITFGTLVVATSATGQRTIQGVDTSKSGTDNNYTLDLIAGTWTVRARSDGFESPNVSVTVLSGGTATQELVLAAISGYTRTEPQPFGFTPSKGGIVKNTDLGSNFEVNLPAGSLGASANSGSVLTKENTAVQDTNTQNVVGGKGIDITPKDAGGTPITTLSSSSGTVTMTIPYTEADVTTAGTTEGKVYIGAWNGTDWEPLSTTCDTTNNKCTATVTHFSTFAVLGAAGVGGGGGGGGGGGSGGGGGTVTIAAATVPTTTTGAVDATASAGGKTTLTTATGAIARVELPANAVLTNTAVKLESVTTSAAVSMAGAAPAGKTIAAAYSLSAASSSGVSVTTFSAPVTVTLTYTALQAAGLDESTLKIYRWTGTAWEALATTVDTVTNTLVATTTKFSYFAIMGAPSTAPTSTSAPQALTVEQLKAKIIEIQLQIIALIKQLIAILQAQIASL